MLTHMARFEFWQFPKRPYLKLTFSQTTFSQRHFPKRNFLNQTLSQCKTTNSQPEMFPTRHFRNWTFSQMTFFQPDIFPNKATVSHFYQKLQLQQFPIFYHELWLRQIPNFITNYNCNIFPILSQIPIATNSRFYHITQGVLECQGDVEKVAGDLPL